MEVENFEVSKSNSEVTHASKYDVLSYLRHELSSYLSKHPHLTLNSLSKRCRVSEPTLRRLHKGQIKTLPTLTTVISLLSYLYGTEEVKEILDSMPLDIKEYFEKKTEFANELDQLTYSEDLSQELEDPIKYLIFKLAANSCGVSLQKVSELFGRYGEKQVQLLKKSGLIEIREGKAFGLKGNFSLSNELFVDHFKAVADFIKPERHAGANPKYSPIFSNFSVGLNKSAYSKILNIQRSANKKIVQVMKNEDAKGDIPTFFLNAIDTLDEKIAEDFSD